jgi:multidrug resistance efflux pump
MTALTTPAQYSALEKHREALREVELRKNVYERLIMKGTMSRSEAERKIAIMQSIADDYERASEKERLL